MRASHDLTRVSVGFDEKDLVPHAGLLPAGAVAQQVGGPGRAGRAACAPGPARQ